MANPYAPLGPNTGYVLSDAATDGMQIGYSRNIEDFRLPQYCLVKPVTVQAGLYRKFNPAVGARLGTNPAADAAWPAGAKRPNGLKNQQESSLVPYQTQRTSEVVETDFLAVQQATWGVEDTNARNLGQIAMTRRTWLAHQALSGAALGSNTAPVDYAQSGSIIAARLPAATAGNWMTGTNQQPNFLISLQYAASQITLATYGAIPAGLGNYVLVVNPNTAMNMAVAPEIQNALGQSQFAGNLVTGVNRLSDAENVILPYNQSFGLPLYYRGVRIVIEDAVYDPLGTPTLNTLGTGSYVMADNTAYLLYVGPKFLDNRIAKPDVTEGDNQLFYPISNSLVQFTKEDFTVEARQLTWDRMTEAAVTYDVQYQCPSSINMFKFTHVYS